MTLYLPFCFVRIAGEWHVATSGVPDASGTLHWRSAVTELKEDDLDGDSDNAEEGEVSAEAKEAERRVDPVSGLVPIVQGDHRKTNAELFWEVFKMLNYKLPAPEDENKCYMFELATPQNIVLIRHPKADLFLHGVRNLTTLQEELPDHYVEKYGWTLAPMKVITGGKDEFEKTILATVNSLDGLKCEGYVICDSQFNRFKLKCTSYVNLALLHTKDGKEWKRLVAIVQINEGSEFLAYFPQHTEIYNCLMQRFNHVLATLEKAKIKFQPLDNRGLAAISSKLPEWVKTPLFLTRRTGEDFKTFFSSPSRYGMLCSILNPDREALENPDFDSMDISSYLPKETEKSSNNSEKASSSS